MYKSTSTVTSTECPDHHESHSSYVDRSPIAQNTTTSFQGAQGISISGQPNFVNIGTVMNQLSNREGPQGFGNFEHFVSFDALHDSAVQEFDRHVDRGIHEKSLKQLQDWIDNPVVTEQIVWLYGPAGIGKTAIALQVARTWQEKVAGTFFFHRPDANRNDGNRLLITLAWQLADSIPDIKSHIIHCLNERPNLQRKGVEAQFEYLVARPFAAMKKATSAVQPFAPIIIIIDGIDECDDTRLQRRILRVIGDAIRDRRVPLRFIISSRPETHIRETFDQFPCPVLCIDLKQFSPAEEMRKKEEELKRWEQELGEKLKEEERKLKERASEITKREEENWHLAEETRLKAEKIKSREEELKKYEEEVRRQKLEIERREGVTRREEPIRQKEAEIKSQEKELEKYKEEVRRQKLEIEKREEVTRREEATRQKEEEIKSREEELKKREEELRWRESETSIEEERQKKARLQELEKKFLLWFEWRREEERLQTPEWRGGSSHPGQQTNLLEAKQRLEELEDTLFPELEEERRRQLEEERLTKLKLLLEEERLLWRRRPGEKGSTSRMRGG